MFALHPPARRPLVHFSMILALLFTALGSIPAATPAAIAASSTVVISQVYGGGASSGATYLNDFIELFNRGTTTVSLAGWSVQYGSAANNFSSKTDLPSASLAPGQYFLIQQAAGSTGAALPTPDATGTIAMSASNGKVALVNSTTLLTCGAAATRCSSGSTPSLVDLVGYGTSSDFEGTAAAPALSATTAAQRRNGGCTETDDNSADFDVFTPTPRNTSTALARCGGGGSEPITPTCGGPLSTEAGTAATRNVTATDADGTVTTAAVTSVTPAPAAGSIAITASTPAAATGGTLQATLTVDAAVPAGSYDATITFGNNDATPQTATCTIAITVSDPAGSCPAGVTLTPIYTIQGSGASSPLANTTVTFEGIVVGDFQASTELSGFFVQDQTGDGAIATSDGIFVFVPSANPLSSVNVSIGERVRVTGQVKEFNALTEIDNVSALNVCSAETPLAPTPVDLPVATASGMEQYEGMVVTFPEALTVSQNYFQGRYGQVTLSAEGRMYTPTNDQGNSLDYNVRRSIVLDDGRTSQNPSPIPYLGADNTLRAGDISTGLTGVVSYGPISSDTSIRHYTLQ
ncbi:MAG TPA: lamin tail domain-containing protein, partial [Herpetosiphonaceae bacterium]